MEASSLCDVIFEIATNTATLLTNSSVYNLRKTTHPYIKNAVELSFTLATTCSEIAATRDQKFVKVVSLECCLVLGGHRAWPSLAVLGQAKSFWSPAGRGSANQPGLSLLTWVVRSA